MKFKFFPNNKKGDKLISVYWFAILVIVATGIVVMVNVFYSSTYDVREIETEILASKIADCIYSGGELNKLIMSAEGVFREDFKDNFMERCSLNFDSNQEFVLPQYYVEVDFLLDGEKNKNRFSIIEGNLNWKKDCELDVSGSDRLAKCAEKEFFVVGPSGNIYLVKILSIIGKVKENVN